MTIELSKVEGENRFTISFLGTRGIGTLSQMLVKLAAHFQEDITILQQDKFIILSIARIDLYSYLGKDAADNLTDDEMTWIAEATHSKLPKHLDDALQEGLKSLGYGRIYIKKH